MRDPSGAMTVPEPHTERIRRRPATAEERAGLDGCGEEVYELQRVRQHGGVPFVAERMRFAANLVAGIEDDAPLPNSLYPYLQERFGLSIMTAEESISAVAAGTREAALLGLAQGQPLLRVERRARDLADRVVELRTSHYLTSFASYRVDLSRSESTPGIDEHG
jgi:GntR family transcriptional regulator